MTSLVVEIICDLCGIAGKHSCILWEPDPLKPNIKYAQTLSLDPPSTLAPRLHHPITSTQPFLNLFIRGTNLSSVVREPSSERCSVMAGRHAGGL